MQDAKYSSTVLISIFKRKGGEGVMTKIITDSNRHDFKKQISSIENNSQPLLCYKENESNWLLLTNNEIIQMRDHDRIEITFSKLTALNLAIKEEFNDRVLSVNNFTRLILIDNSHNRHVFRIESGKPFQGIYQVLHHILSKNKSR